MTSFKDELFSDYLPFFIVFIIGLIELSVVLVIILVRKKRSDKWYRSRGVITDVQARQGSKGGTVYHPVFQFTTYSGEVITHESKIGSTPGRYKKDDEVEVAFNPDNPSKFIILGDKRLNLSFGILAGAALIMVIVGLVKLYPLFMKYYGESI